MLSSSRLPTTDHATPTKFTEGCPVYFNFQPRSRSHHVSAATTDVRKGVVKSVSLSTNRKRFEFQIEGRRPDSAISGGRPSLVDGVSEDDIAYAVHCSVLLTLGDQKEIEGKVLFVKPLTNQDGRVISMSYIVQYAMEDHILRMEEGVTPDRISFHRKTRSAMHNDEQAHKRHDASPPMVAPRGSSIQSVEEDLENVINVTIREDSPLKEAVIQHESKMVGKTRSDKQQYFTSTSNAMTVHNPAGKEPPADALNSKALTGPSFNGSDDLLVSGATRRILENMDQAFLGAKRQRRLSQEMLGTSHHVRDMLNGIGRQPSYRTVAYDNNEATGGFIVHRRRSSCSTVSTLGSRGSGSREEPNDICVREKLKKRICGARRVSVGDLSRLGTASGGGNAQKRRTQSMRSFDQDDSDCDSGCDLYDISNEYPDSEDGSDDEEGKEITKSSPATGESERSNCRSLGASASVSFKGKQLQSSCQLEVVGEAPAVTFESRNSEPTQDQDKLEERLFKSMGALSTSAIADCGSDEEYAGKAETEDATSKNSQASPAPEQRGIGTIWDKLRSAIIPGNSLLQQQSKPMPEKEISGATYFRCGKRKVIKCEFLQAITLFNVALARQREELDEDHIDCGTTLNEIGVCWMMLGERDPALTAFEEALYIREMSLGVDAGEVAETTNNMWMLLRGNNYELEAMMEEGDEEKGVSLRGS